MKPIVEIFDQGKFAGAVADEIATLISECISEKGSCTVALSGGKTPGTIYRHLSMPPRVGEVEWDKVTFFLGDERYVSHDDVQSNYRMVKETLVAAKNVIAVDTTHKDAKVAAENYEAEIKKHLKGTPPQFDIVLLGIGEDGHTASLFPGTSVLNSERLVEAVEKGRITLTPKIIFTASQVLFIVKGENKAKIFKEVLEGNATPETYPARLFSTASGKVSFLVDSAAGALLGKK